MGFSAVGDASTNSFCVVGLDTSRSTIEARKVVADILAWGLGPRSFEVGLIPGQKSQGKHVPCPL